jgi:hypothetical protein
VAWQRAMNGRHRTTPSLERATSRAGGRVGGVAWGSAKRREEAELALDNPGVASCGVCGRRWERPTLRWAVREFEEHDCPAGEAARTRRTVKAAEREIACEACGWLAVTEKYRGPALLAEHRKVCPNKAEAPESASA